MTSRLCYPRSTTIRSKHQLLGLAVFRRFAMGLLLGCWAFSSMAGQSTSGFGVAVTLVKPGGSSTTGLCSSQTVPGAFGATVTVVCGTTIVAGLEVTAQGMPWRPVHGGAYRFLTRFSVDDVFGTVDSYTGVGTSTTFRIIGASGQEYVEMTVGW